MKARIAAATVAMLCVAAAATVDASAVRAAAINHCLVGRWTLTASVGPGGGQGGLQGVKMTISAAGVASLDYTHARPAEDQSAGMTATFRGHSTIDITTTGGSQPAISVEHERLSLTQKSTFGATPPPKYDPVWQYSEFFSCSAHSLKLTQNTNGGGLLQGATFRR